MAVSLKTDLRFPESGQQGHGTRIIQFFKGQCRYPKFKSKKHSTPSFYQDNIKIQFTDTHVKVERFSMSKKQNKQKLNWIKLCEKGRIPTDCKYMNPRFIMVS